jgi:uncharacterized membrane protein YcaP (DUF421 family)
MNLDALFGIDIPATELVVRGTLMYWFLFVLFRFVLRREAGALGLADMLLLVVVADAAQNGFSGRYDSITEGIILVSTIVLWNVALDYLAFHIPAVARFAEPRPLPLIRDGRVLQHNLRKQYITHDELMSQLRQQGVEDVVDVKQAYMESDGHMSVIRRRGPRA